MKLNGYDLRTLAKMLEGVNSVTRDVVANLEKEENRQKTFDELWDEDRVFVRTDLALLAVLGAARLGAKPAQLEQLADFILEKEKCRARLLEVCRTLYVPEVVLEREDW